MLIVVFEILLIIFLTVANGIFSMSELAIVSARRVRLQQRAKKGDKGALAALELAEEPNSFLSTVQIGITLIGILAGAVGGATIAEQLGAKLSLIPTLEPYGETLGIVIVVIVITYLSVVVGELIPKRLALNNAEGVAVIIARPMRLLSRIASPAVHLLSLSTEGLLRLFRVRDSGEPPITEEEVKLMMNQGAQAGMFEKAERDMVEGVFKLGDKIVSALMTPRKEIVWLDIQDSLEETKRKISSSIFSTFPVANDHLDKILGVVQTKDLLDRNLTGQQMDIKALLRTPLFVPVSMPALRTLEVFKKHRKHMALVVDEYGGLQGLITIHDILEAIVGDIPFTDEPQEMQAVQREDGSWLLDGMLPIERFMEIFQIEKLPGEEQGFFQTLGGFVMTHLGRIPVSGEIFEWTGLRFEIVDMDGQRVDKVLVMLIKSKSHAEKKAESR
jgi:putative hemolysin